MPLGTTPLGHLVQKGTGGGTGTRRGRGLRGVRMLTSAPLGLPGGWWALGARMGETGWGRVECGGQKAGSFNVWFWWFLIREGLGGDRAGEKCPTPSLPGSFVPLSWSLCQSWGEATGTEDNGFGGLGLKGAVSVILPWRGAPPIQADGGRLCLCPGTLSTRIRGIHSIPGKAPQSAGGVPALSPGGFTV